MTTARMSSKIPALRSALTISTVTSFKVLVGNGGLNSLLAHSFYFLYIYLCCLWSTLGRALRSFRDQTLLFRFLAVWKYQDQWVFLVAKTSNEYSSTGSQMHAITIVRQGILILVIHDRCTCDFYHAIYQINC